MNSSNSGGLFLRVERFQSQRSRRLIAGFFNASLIALLVVTWFIDSYWLAVPFFGFYAVGTLMLLASTRGITSEDSNRLDEHQISVRNAVFKQAYMIGIAVAMAGGYLISSISDTDTAFELGVWVSVFGFVATLPAQILAWTLPGEDSDED